MASKLREKPSRQRILQTLGLSALFFCFVLALLFGIMTLNKRHTKDLLFDDTGAVDMTGWVFEKRGMNFLESGWSVYPGVILEPSSFADNSADKIPHYTNFRLSALGWVKPGDDAVWSETASPAPSTGSFQVATYHLIVRVSSEYDLLSMDFPELNQAARIYINGKLVRVNGTIAESKEDLLSDTSTPILDIAPDQEGTLDIVIQSASFTAPYPGVCSSPGIGTGEQVSFLTVVSRMWLTSVFTLLFLIVVIGFYVSFTFENRNKYYFFILLIFSALSFDFFDRSYNPLPDRWNFLLQITVYLIMSIFSIMYFSSLFSKNISSFFNKLTRVDAYIFFAIISVLIILFWLRPDEMSQTMPIWITAILVCVIHLYLLAKIIYVTILSKDYGAFHIVSAIMATMVFASMLLRTQSIFYIPLHSISIMLLILGTVMYFTIQYVGANNQVSRFTQELEVAVQDKTRNIAKVNSELLLANKRLLENEDARKKMMSNVSHDLRTPITAIRGYIELLLRAGNEFPAETRETYLKNMHTRCMQMEQLIEDLMQLTRLESGEVIGEMETLSLSEIISSLYDLYESESQHEGKKINLSLPKGDPLLVKGDPNNLLRVFDNLLVNALRYTGENADIRIEAFREKIEPEGEVIHIVVSDNGCGIPEAEIPYVFDRFYRASNSSIMKNGTGLGLAIVRSIIKKHSGQVWVDSREGVGSTFHVKLPATADDSYDSEEQEIQEEESP